MNCSTCGRPADDGYVNVVAGERCVDEVHDEHLDPELALYAAHVRERIAEASARSAVWTRRKTPGGMTVHERGEFRIESSAGRSLNGDPTGYRAGSVHLFRAGEHVTGHVRVRDAKAHAARLELEVTS